METTHEPAYFQAIARLLREFEATDNNGNSLSHEAAFMAVEAKAKKAHESGGKTIFVGNGGSTSIASHMAIDYAKNGKMRAMTFTDAPTITCLGNDLGFDQVFAKQVEMLGAPNDLLIAISSSGGSANILNAANEATAIGMDVVTLSGFKPDNPLRGKGSVNFHVASKEYGFVEITHLAILHAILDLSMGWTPQNGLWENMK